jgi:hypothetical protein
MIRKISAALAVARLLVSASIYICRHGQWLGTVT